MKIININKKIIPIILISFALLDLKTEIRILIDHFTLTSIIYTIKHHSLSVLILAFSPSLLRHYKS